MTVIRPASYETGATTYVASLALICSLASMTIMMLKFRGFRASFNLNFTGKKEREDLENYPVATDSLSTTTGVYRENREEFFGYGSFSEPPKKITPSMVKLPPSQKSKPQTQAQTLVPNESSLKSYKSTSDLSEAAPIEVPTKLRKSQPNVSSDPRGASHKDRDSTDFYRKEPPKLTKTQNKEMKLLEKQQRKQLKLAKEEQAKEAKQKKEKDKKKKTKEDKPPPLPKSAPPTMPVPAQPTNPLTDSTNNRDSSISRTTGPPPYTDVPDKLRVIPNKSDDTGNTSFGKPIEEPTSWDLVTRHREQVGRPVGQQKKPREMVMDLQYNVGNKTVDNSDA